MATTADLPPANDREAALFSHGASWADMTRWHHEIADVRSQSPALLCEPPGMLPFVALTRYDDIFEVSRNHETWHNTERAVLGREADYDAMAGGGTPTPATLIHLDGAEHRGHRAVTSDWFRPRIVEGYVDRFAELADEFIAVLADAGGQCGFAAEIAVPFTLRAIMEIYGVPREDEALMLRLTQMMFGAGDDEYREEGQSASDALIIDRWSYLRSRTR